VSKSGPKTPEGKARVSRNAIKHGLLAKTVVLEGENRQLFRKLLTEFMDEFQPATAVERALVETLAVTRWRQLRLWGIEKAGLTHQMANQDQSIEDEATRAALAFQSQMRSLELLNRYEARYDRQFNRALVRLTNMRENRTKT
jgi:hypothetical protein